MNEQSESSSLRSSPNLACRRAISGVGPSGKSTVVLHDPIPEGVVTTIWHTPRLPACNVGADDSAPPYATELLHSGGSLFMLVRMPPGVEQFWHATDTIDYITMISGSVTLMLEDGEVLLSAGDVCVDRGVVHSWRNDGSETAVYTCVILPAEPVGAGRTV